MIVKCENCKKEFDKKPSLVKRTKHNFCSLKCCHQQKDINIYNRGFFENIDTEEKSYWLGFILADGNISKNSNRMHITLARKDAKHLTKFCDIFKKILEEFEHEGFSHGGKIKTKVLYSSRCSICSRKMWNDLYEKGIYPNKTYIDDVKIFKSIPNNLLNHFIRGFFDGDGSISRMNKKDKYNVYQFHIVGNEKILNLVSDILSKKCGINKIRVFSDTSIHRMYCAGNYQLVAIREWLYKDANVYLERKRDIFYQVKGNRKKATSTYNGVSFIKKRKKWQSMISVHKKRIFLGYFDDETEAARAYNRKARENDFPKYKLNLI